MFKEFQRIGRFLFQEGLIDSHGGNMSVREGDKIFITHKDAMLGDLQEKDIVEAGIEPGENDKFASREIVSHRAIYKSTGAKAVVHAHPGHAIAVSITDNKVVPQDAEGISLFKAASIIRVRDGAGSEEAARLLPSFLSNGNKIAMVKGHGSFAVGENLEEAYKYTSSLENSCKIIIAVRASGGQQKHFSREGREGRELRRSAIPEGLGVMDRSRERSRYRQK